MGTNPSFICDIITDMISFFVKYCTVETGISDYHKLVMSICKPTLAKGKSKKFFHCYYQNFDCELFEQALTDGVSLKSFKTTFRFYLEKFASLKLKYSRYSNNPFMDRFFRKTIITNLVPRAIF